LILSEPLITQINPKICVICVICGSDKRRKKLFHSIELTKNYYLANLKKTTLENFVMTFQKISNNSCDIVRKMLLKNIGEIHKMKTDILRISLLTLLLMSIF